MEAKELMINNWVYNTYRHEYKVLHLHGKKRNAYTPIPLTEEWLVKFGFEENSTSFTNSIAYPCIVKLKNQSNCIFYNSLQIKHVHQLQNLYFALTNEELTIKK